MAHAKANPGKLSFASSSNGGAPHLAGELFKLMAGVDMAHVPYRGSGQAVPDLIAGNVQVMFNSMPSSAGAVREGRLRALAVGSAKRVAYVPGLEAVPGMAELLPGTDMDMEFWYCISVPAGTPPAVVRRLHEATVAAARTPAYADKLLPLGFNAVTDESPEAFTDFIRRQDPVWRDLVAVSGAQLE